MSRTTDILSRVYRNLRRYGINTNDLIDQEIFDELVLGQDDIISSTEPDEELTLTFREGVQYYALTTDNAEATNIVKLSQYIKTGINLTGTKDGVNTEFVIPEANGIIAGSEQIFLNGILQIRAVDYSISGVTVTILSSTIPDVGDTLVGNWIESNSVSIGLTSYKNNISEIKVVQKPDGYFNNFKVVSNSEYVSITNIATVETGQPTIGTIIGKLLKVYPIPNSDTEGKTVDLIVYKKTSIYVIDQDHEPELDEEYDKALECFATAQFLIGKERMEWMNTFSTEKERLKRLTHKKRGPIESKSIVPGW